MGRAAHSIRARVEVRARARVGAKVEARVRWAAPPGFPARAAA